MGHLLPTMPRPRAHGRSVCAYCGTDPVKAACINCGAPQLLTAEPAGMEMVEVTGIGDSVRRFIPAMRDESFRN